MSQNLMALLYLVSPWGFYARVFAAVSIGSGELLSMTHPGDRVADSRHLP